MICPECEKNNPAGVSVCKGCGARLENKMPPSMITINLPDEEEIEYDEYERRSPVSRGVIAGLIAVGLVVAAGLILAVVLLAGQPDKQAFSPQNSGVVVVTPTPTPSPTPTPTPTPTPVPTTRPDGEDYSSLFE